MCAIFLRMHGTGNCKNDAEKDKNVVVCFQMSGEMTNFATNLC